MSQDKPESNDSAMVAEAREGSYEAFEILVGRHERRLYRLAMQILRSEKDAEDAVQTAFLSALEHLHDFREDASFGTWIARILTNAALKILRGRRGEVSAEFDGDADAVPDPECIAPWCRDPLERVADTELRSLLDEAIDELPETYRVVFILRDLQGLDTRSAAEILGIGEGNVKVRLLRARMALREKLTQVFGDFGADVLRETGEAST